MFLLQIQELLRHRSERNIRGVLTLFSCFFLCLGFTLCLGLTFSLWLFLCLRLPYVVSIKGLLLGLYFLYRFCLLSWRNLRFRSFFHLRFLHVRMLRLVIKRSLSGRFPVFSFVKRQVRMKYVRIDLGCKLVLVSRHVRSEPQTLPLRLIDFPRSLLTSILDGCQHQQSPLFGLEDIGTLDTDDVFLWNIHAEDVEPALRTVLSNEVVFL